ncbi:MAG: hypothetical protein IM536_15305, partial [Pseudanabaena sp. M34BS1SP1A06MG]|nr:hypothetical protein [Pseudanabaena sp. M34BS1SP1A06MG]
KKPQKFQVKVRNLCSNSQSEKTKQKNAQTPTAFVEQQSLFAPQDGQQQVNTRKKYAELPE